ncbi:metallophosphoesterase family protein [Pseudoroseomonas wenyumeiae]
MRVIDHISDLHFNRIDTAAAAGLLEALNADPADLVAVSGDLTMRARSREFRAAAEFLSKLKAPWIAVPGNHDITAFYPWERFFDPFGRWHKYVSPQTEPLWRDDEVAVIGLNTVIRADWNLKWEGGRVPHHGLKNLLERLDALPKNLFRIVVAHHPFLAPEERPDTPLARHAAPALERLAKAGVRLILSGHLHRDYVRLHRGAAGSAPGCCGGSSRICWWCRRARPSPPGCAATPMPITASWWRRMPPASSRAAGMARAGCPPPPPPGPSSA